MIKEEYGKEGIDGRKIEKIMGDEKKMLIFEEREGVIRVVLKGEEELGEMEKKMKEKY